MTSFISREEINQARLIKSTLAVETVLEDMILTNDKIQITDKTAVESIDYVKETHQKYLIDGLSPKESKKNIWEKRIQIPKKSKENKKSS